MNHTNGIVTTEIPQNMQFELSGGILSIFGLKHGGSQLTAGRHIGNKRIDFVIPKELRLSVDQTKTVANYVDGAPNILLGTIPFSGNPFGHVVSHRYELPVFKKKQKNLQMDA